MSDNGLWFAKEDKKPVSTKNTARLRNDSRLPTEESRHELPSDHCRTMALINVSDSSKLTQFLKIVGKE